MYQQQIKNTYFEIYIYQESCPFDLPDIIYFCISVFVYLERLESSIRMGDLSRGQILKVLRNM